MNILVTGSEGYIMRLTWLAARGHRVTGLDSGYYRDGTLYLDPIGLPELRVPFIRIYAPSRWLISRDLKRSFIGRTVQ